MPRACTSVGEEFVEGEKPEWLAQMEGVLETLNEAVIIADDSERIVFTNSAFHQMTGFPEDAMLGETADRLWAPEEMAFLLKQREKGLPAGRNQFEFVLPTKARNRVPVIISGRDFEDPAGRKFGVVTFTDISEQKRAEEQLREANSKLEERQKEIEERQKEIEQDLRLAAQVQQSLAPKPIVWGGARVDTYFRPVHHIGGDFGLVSPQGDDHLNLFVGDVSGHGIGAALVANRLYSETMAQLRARTSLVDMLRQLNRFVMQDLGGSALFLLTVAVARLDRGARRMVFAGAGHPPGMIVTPGQEPRLLESRSMLLGAHPNAVDTEATLEVDLDPGDRILLYTDGITDIFNAGGEMLGVPGVQKFVRETSLLPFAEMKHSILDRVGAWREGPPSDDVSLVLVEVL